MWQLDHLSTVEVGCAWPCLDHPKDRVGELARRNGSPLARSWDFFDATPIPWRRDLLDGEDPLVYPRGSHGFWTITTALSKTQRSISKFKLKGYVEASTFDAQSIAAAATRLSHGISAFAKLKKLKLKINFGMTEEGDLASGHHLNGLKVLLDGIRDIEHVELALPEGYFTAYQWVLSEHIFSQDGAWLQLRNFAINNLSISPRNLIKLLFVQMPSVQHLKISDIKLVDGHWESVIEALMFLHLSSINIILSAYAYKARESQFLFPVPWDWTDGVSRSFLESSEWYIIHGTHDWTLRHPSLEDSQPTQDSLHYLCDIFDEANEGGCWVDSDVPSLKNHIAKVCAEAEAERQTAEIIEGRYSYLICCKS